MARIERVDLGVVPTPVEEFSIAGRRVLVKRDDRIGGNKVRSLEFLLAQPAERLLTYSTLSAHHAYATAVCGRKLGLKTTAIIVRKGRRGACLDALNEVCDGGYVEVDSYLGAALARLRLQKRGTLVIPPGCMCAHGALGYLHAVEELEKVPGRIYVPLGTGTTVSGLLAGLMLREADCEVVGVRVADAFAGWKWLLWRRAKKALRLLGQRRGRGRVRLRVVKAEGEYGEATEASDAAVKAAGKAGLELESTYTGKTLALLLSERAEGAMFLNTYAGSLP
jgi:1-aminocyclopropane-1-carboxylate deaminase/D-cysteine desulfhydrase-like pyridoxal-dependent ACC family enzyme